MNSTRAVLIIGAWSLVIWPSRAAAVAPVGADRVEIHRVGIKPGPNLASRRVIDPTDAVLQIRWRRRVDAEHSRYIIEGISRHGQQIRTIAVLRSGADVAIGVGRLQKLDQRIVLNQVRRAAVVIHSITLDRKGKFSQVL